MLNGEGFVPGFDGFVPARDILMNGVNVVAFWFFYRYLVGTTSVTAKTRVKSTDFLNPWLKLRSWKEQFYPRVICSSQE
jgi:hypothetical protein